MARENTSHLTADDSWDADEDWLWGRLQAEKLPSATDELIDNFCNRVAHKVSIGIPVAQARTIALAEVMK